MMWLGGTLALFLIGIIVVVSIVRETRELPFRAAKGIKRVKGVKRLRAGRMIPFPDHPGKRLRPGGRGAC